MKLSSVGAERMEENVSRLMCGIVLFATLCACATLLPALNPPQVSLAGLELKEMGLFEQRFVLRLRLQNPNSVGLPIAGMRYNLSINDQDFAQGVSDRAVDIPAHGEAVTEVDVTSNLQSLFNQFTAAARGGGELSYRLSGYVSILNRALKLPFEYSGNVGLTKPR